MTSLSIIPDYCLNVNISEVLFVLFVCVKVCSLVHSAYTSRIASEAKIWSRAAIRHVIQSSYRLRAGQKIFVIYHLHLTMTRHFNLALLICDTPLPEVIKAHGTYLDIFRTHFQKSLHSLLQAKHQDSDSVRFTLDGYDVVKETYPSDEKLASYDGIVITGSGE